MNPCSPNPCHNGGTCARSEEDCTQHICLCPACYTGPTCSTCKFISNLKDANILHRLLEPCMESMTELVSIVYLDCNRIIFSLKRFICWIAVEVNFLITVSKYCWVPGRTMWMRASFCQELLGSGACIWSLDTKFNLSPSKICKNYLSKFHTKQDVVFKNHILQYCLQC